MYTCKKQFNNIKTPLVSVVLPTYNAEGSISSCINSLLKQSYQKFEVIISDDSSSDNTLKVVRGYKDKRIKTIVSKTNRGASSARNAGIEAAKGELIFFLDDDERVKDDWLKTGLSYFKDPAVIGIEGKIVYVSKGYRPRFSDYIRQNTQGSHYMTGNAAYRSWGFSKCGLFDTAQVKYQDRELALRMLRYGKICFTSDNTVIHQREIYTVKTYMDEAKRVKWWLGLYKKHHDKALVWGFIYEPKKLCVILFPPLILIKLFQLRIVDKKDFIIFSLYYPRLVYERVSLWFYAIRNRVFII
jgi:glycosyltransferase involved in cell wall biosynthesis